MEYPYSSKPTDELHTNMCYMFSNEMYVWNTTEMTVFFFWTQQAMTPKFKSPEKIFSKRSGGLEGDD